MSDAGDRSVLFLAYHYPPSGGAGVQRSVKFVRYLPEHGFRPRVVTRPAERGGWFAGEDPSLAAETGGAPVFRVPGPEPSAGRLRRGLARALRVPLPFARWWIEGALVAGREAARDARPDLVFATMDPYESAAAAARLAGELGVPWVADLRDPWALDEMRDFPSALHRRLEQRRMGRALASAAAVVMNTPEARRAARQAFPALRPERVFEIPNGFDASDFAGAPPPRRDDDFRIVHTGYLHTALGLEQQRGLALRRALGGQRVPTSFLTRSHVYLLKALEAWRAAQPEAAARARLVLAGALSDVDRAVVAASPLADRVEMPGPLPHGESVALVQGADLLFLPMQDLPPGKRARIVPGKTYEYLASGRPILAAVPDGDARDLLAASGRALLCRPDDVAGMARALARAAAQDSALARSGPIEPDLARRFERRALTSRLAEVFDAVLGG